MEKNKPALMGLFPTTVGMNRQVVVYRAVVAAVSHDRGDEP